jgi:hypothetical protein
MPAACRPEELFTLDILSPHLMGFQPPQGPHDPAGDWRLTYRLYSLGATAGIGGRVANVQIGRKRLAADRFAMQIECLKPTARRFAAKLAARIEARGARLAEPVQWSWNAEIVDPSGTVIPDSRLQRSARLEGSALQLGPRKLVVSGPCTMNWLLMEAVGRLPHEAFPALSFTLLEDFDRPKPGHTLHYAQSVAVLLGERDVRQTRIEQLEQGRIHKTVWGRAGGQAVRLHVYHHLGEGSVPWVYWVDDQGRLLFAISGIEAYALDSFAK